MQLSHLFIQQVSTRTLLCVGPKGWGHSERLSPTILQLRDTPVPLRSSGKFSLN